MKPRRRIIAAAEIQLPQLVGIREPAEVFEVFGGVGQADSVEVAFGGGLTEVGRFGDEGVEVDFGPDVSSVGITHLAAVVVDVSQAHGRFGVATPVSP